MKFVEWLQKEIELRGISQRELARRAGLGNATVARILNETRNPGLDFCHAVAHALHVPVEDVLRQAGLIEFNPDSETELTQALIDRLKYLTVAERKEIYELADQLYQRKHKRP